MPIIYNNKHQNRYYVDKKILNEHKHIQDKNNF